MDGLYAAERRDYPCPQQWIDTPKSVCQLPHATERGGAFLFDRDGTERPDDARVRGFQPGLLPRHLRVCLAHGTLFRGHQGTDYRRDCRCERREVDYLEASHLSIPAKRGSGLSQRGKKKTATMDGLKHK